MKHYTLDRSYIPRKEGGRGVISVENCIELAIRGLEVMFMEVRKD